MDAGRATMVRTSLSPKVSVSDVVVLRNLMVAWKPASKNIEMTSRTSRMDWCSETEKTRMDIFSTVSSAARQLMTETRVLPVRRGMTTSTHCTTLLRSHLLRRMMAMELASKTLPP